MLHTNEEELNECCPETDEESSVPPHESGGEPVAVAVAVAVAVTQG